jgi:hypothetical protein
MSIYLTGVALAIIEIVIYLVVYANFGQHA